MFPVQDKKRILSIKDFCEKKLDGIEVNDTPRKTLDSKLTKDYIFFPYMDSPAGDIYYSEELDINSMVDACKEKNGLGFNTNGWIKNKVESQRRWNVNKTDYTTRKEGFY